MSKIKNVVEFSTAVREHWGIENELHWCLDMGFREDESRARKDHAAESLNIIRHMTMNMLKKEKRKNQTFDSAYWIAEKLSHHMKGITIGIYAGGDKSGIVCDGQYQKRTKEDIKKMVKSREIKILLGTDAASEGLNLQTLGTLINLDLPWNPTRLEQREGRIQRIGQLNDAL